MGIETNNRKPWTGLHEKRSHLIKVDLQNKYYQESLLAKYCISNESQIRKVSEISGQSFFFNTELPYILEYLMNFQAALSMRTSSLAELLAASFFVAPA